MSQRVSTVLGVMACLGLFAGVAGAGEAEAQAKLDEAWNHWGDEDPANLLKLCDEAAAAGPESKGLHFKILLLTGSVHHVKTGDLDKAVECYDQLIRGITSGDPPELRALKADAMVRKGNILYSEKNDKRGALQLYISANQMFPRASTVDVASQLCLRMAREPERSKDQIEFFGEKAEGLAKEAVERVEAEFGHIPEKLKEMRAKFQLQLALTQMARQKAEEAEATYAAIDQTGLTEASLYQQAMWDSQHGNNEAAREKLVKFMETRPTPKTRNQLRKFIRNEAEFRGLLDQEPWKQLTTDEPEPRRPRGRPAGSH